MAGGEVRIAHGHLDVGMPQQLLDRLQAGTPHDQVSGEGVAEVMKAKIVDSCLAAGGLKAVGHGDAELELGLEDRDQNTVGVGLPAPQDVVGFQVPVIGRGPADYGQRTQGQTLQGLRS